MLARDPVASGKGVNGAPVGLHVHRFTEFHASTKAYSNVAIEVEDATLSADILLGMDFMKWRRVWLSYPTGRVFMQQHSHHASGKTAPPARAEVRPASPDDSFDVSGQLAAVANAASTPDAPPSSRPNDFSSDSHIASFRSAHLIAAPRIPSVGYKPGPSIPYPTCVIRVLAGMV